MTTYTVRAWQYRLEYATQEIWATSMEDAVAQAKSLNWDGIVFADTGAECSLEELRVEDDTEGAETEESWTVEGGLLHKIETLRA